MPKNPFDTLASMFNSAFKEKKDEEDAQEKKGDKMDDKDDKKVMMKVKKILLGILSCFTTFDL